MLLIMALVPSRHFYCPASSKTSAFILNRIIHLQNFAFYATRNGFSSISKNPPSNSLSFSRNPRYSHEKCTWLQCWNKPQLQIRPNSPPLALDYRNDSDSDSDSVSVGSDSGGGDRTMDKIVEKLKKFGYIDGGGDGKKEMKAERVIEKGSVEDIFYVEEGILPNTRGGFTRESPFGDKNPADVKFPWERNKKVEGEQEGGLQEWTARKRSRTSLAELTLPESELRRLINLTFRIKTKTTVRGSGVTQAVVDAIHEKWKTSEIVRVKVEGPPALNMKRMHESLERKTGGLVIWRSGSSVSLYRGVSYEVPEQKHNKQMYKKNDMSPHSLLATTNKTIRDPFQLNSDNTVDAKLINDQTTSETEDKRDVEPTEEVKYEDEIDQLLDTLGPRYTDWPGCEPLPVDADMLRGIVPGYKPPFRVLPYGVRKSLGLNEATALRRLARVLPPHFAIGRSRQLQGLAAAMVKLWEKSSIAKIALKRGVMLTTSERMAEEIKRLTGSILLSRNKDFLVFYRGKDFLSPDVSKALLERERLAKSLQNEEEQARLRASAFLVPSVNTNEPHFSNPPTEKARTAGTLEETLDADAKWGKNLDDSYKEKLKREAEIKRHADLVRKLERKLSFAERKLMRAERALAKVEEFLKPTERQAYPESITDEERFMFRKLGLRMKAFLLLGRRGVFDGTVENMHLHWKYRELVKILVKAKTFEQVKKVALALEAESGGVLVSVDKVSKGYAIIVYRGKDYQRPSKLRPKNLLTKRKALARSIELQRQEALLKHISTMQANVQRLRTEIEQMNLVEDQGDEALYDRLNSAYPSEDDNSEDEVEEAYLETYNSERDYENEHGGSIHNSHMETNFPYDNQYDSKTESFNRQLDSDVSEDGETENEGDWPYFEAYDGEDEDK